jgi:AcrR family transcriptional regulator
VRLQEIYSDAAESASGPAERAILRAGIRLFGSRGFAASSVRRIAAEAGVTPPLIAYHFESKEGLFKTCIEVVTVGLASILVDAIDATEGLSPMVRRLTVAHIDFPKQHPGAVRLMLSVAYGPQECQPAVDLVAPWTGVLERVESRVSAAIESGELIPRPGTDAVQLTRHMFNLLHMAIFAEYEREQFCDRFGRDSRFVANCCDPVDDIYDQFFLGAGRLATPDHQHLEETP